MVMKRVEVNCQTQQVKEFDLTPEEEAAALAQEAAAAPFIAAQQADADDIQTAKAYPKLQALRTMRPAEVGAWVDANVTDFATAKDAIRTLAMAVCILARRM